jgi:hypothetical protein
MYGHWSCACCTPKHLTDLYQASLKQNTVETNFIHKDDFESHNLDVNVCLDVSDFFENPDKTDNMLNDGILEND